ncbi:MAG: homocysteine S-methyltransferase family protein [Rhodopseudomonas palustris]|nr:homocysteine S-methyltransferase family protein [Rhodopseudomonas palustris]
MLTQPRGDRRASTARYLDAGADIVETNTFNSNAIVAGRLRHRARWCDELNLAAAHGSRARAADDVARAQPGEPRFVAGALGPTNRTASISPDVNDPGYRNVTFDELRDAYREQMRRRWSRAASTSSWSRRSSTR